MDSSVFPFSADRPRETRISTYRGCPLGISFPDLLTGVSLLLCTLLPAPVSGQTDLAGGEVLSAHPFGLLMSRIPADFKVEAVDHPVFSIQWSSGNLWLPRVDAYLPMYAADRERLAGLPWHVRQFHFDPQDRPAKSTAFSADGVIRSLDFKISVPLPGRQDLSVRLRGFSLTRGRVPHSLLSSDAFIEWFHSSIAGGEDPFGRKRYGFDDAGIFYRDFRGRQWSMEGGDAILSGVDLHHQWYPDLRWLARYGLRAAVGYQIGINTHRINRSVDGALTGTLSAGQPITRQSRLDVEIRGGVVRHGFLGRGEGLMLTDRHLRWTGRLRLGYGRNLTRNRVWGVSTGVGVASSYFQPYSFEDAVLSGDRVTTHWPYAITHLSKLMIGNDLSVHYTTRSFCLSAYLREDFAVNNAPDLQTGIGFQYRLQSRATTTNDGIKPTVGSRVGHGRDYPPQRR